ncbi:MAG: hypothetical protein ACXAEN_21870 [Candidatus Thorarchaeota archaeon]|jgi:hypothetical protein
MKVAGVKPVSENVIGTYFHCGLCMAELPENESPRNYARLEVGFTDCGVQVRCVRHDANVVHIDFEGHRHPANTTLGGN